MISDLTPYDASVGKAVLELRSEQGGLGLPLLGCISAIWLGTNADKQQLGKFVTSETACNLSSDVKSGTSGVPGAASILPSRHIASFGSDKPVLDESKFRYSCQMSDGTLKLRQSVHNRWGDDLHYKVQFEAIVNSHNQRFNPTWATYKGGNKRTADEIMSGTEDAEAVSLSGVTGLQISEYAVVEAHPSFDLVVAEDGALYLHGLMDSIVCTKLALCGFGDGVYDVGEEAQKTKSTHGGRINF
jgi:hypothetical protein